jgi:hypothetical protein
MGPKHSHYTSILTRSLVVARFMHGTHESYEVDAKGKKSTIYMELAQK